METRAERIVLRSRLARLQASRLPPVKPLSVILAEIVETGRKKPQPAQPSKPLFPVMQEANHAKYKSQVQWQRFLLLLHAREGIVASITMLGLRFRVRLHPPIAPSSITY